MDDLSVRLSRAVKAQADYIAGLSFGDLGGRTVKQVKKLLLDAVGCMAYGASSFSPEAFPDGGYAVVGGGRKDKASALFLNGSAMVARELDEGNRYSAGHPSCHIFPALLSELSDCRASGREVICAVAAAYEVSCRWGYSVSLPPVMHVHGTMQNAGGAALSCKLHGCGAEETEKAVVLACSLPQATSWQSAIRGEQVRNAYIGVSSLIGANAFRLVRAGFGSDYTVLAQVWRDVLRASVRPEDLAKDLGKTEFINMNYFKMYSACRFTHCFLDMAKDFIAGGLEPSEVESVKASTYSSAARLGGREANNALALRFSIPMTLGLLFARGDYLPEYVTDEAARDQEILAFARKVDVEADPAYDALLPEIRRSRLLVRTFGGRVFEKETDVSGGDFEDPYTDAELLDKFRRLASAAYPPERVREIEEFILSLEEKPDAGELVRML